MDQNEKPIENKLISLESQQIPATVSLIPSNKWYKLVTIGMVLLILLGVAYFFGTRSFFNKGKVAQYTIPPTDLPLPTITTVVTLSPTEQNPTNEELYTVVSQHKAELLKGTDAFDLKYNSARNIGTDLYLVDFAYIKQDGSTLPSEGGHVLVGKIAGNWVVAIGLPTDPYYCQWISQSNLSETDKNYFLSNSACPVPNNKCDIQGVTGPCKALMPAYYFDKITQQCIKFNYGGCAPGTRPFTTQTECEKSCSVK